MSDLVRAQIRARRRGERWEREVEGGGGQTDSQKGGKRERERERQTDRHTDRDRETERQRQTDRQTERTRVHVSMYECEHFLFK